jgi:hypothetical protein
MRFHLLRCSLQPQSIFQEAAKGLTIRALSVACAASSVVIASVAFETLRGINPSVYLVPGDIVPRMGQGSVSRIHKLVAGLNLFFMRMAVSAKGILMADRAHLLLLGRAELMPAIIIRSMVKGSRPAIRVTGAA